MASEIFGIFIQNPPSNFIINLASQIRETGVFLN